MFLDTNVSGKSRKRKFEESRKNYLLQEEEYSHKKHLMRVYFMEEHHQWEKEEHELKIKSTDCCARKTNKRSDEIAFCFELCLFFIFMFFFLLFFAIRFPLLKVNIFIKIWFICSDLQCLSPKP